ncbi:glycine--tRNA ligase [Candidatus Peregrinibacteria bacterium CG22_combo_CG10-13_8_21_14_all_44_10]|nr:MAG: glycine--tRNA ligase [Candidatus Peregrinibacteria bacterium CG2_30_44_17]PIP66326.1 MAG: glycine--tRNA ligase [Candidatus Peregrinibacteria bacterium CG22_combo_CG10-13_8_21_14_all_44_10]PIS03945.1 MAG: glycine--tRNA ligase [Candidatus Peregrinibacteria bacterium CG10_big_fil_rev_8_21_14_0_10_44_7]PIX79491.1 MAG: glycine--tRNA ligase [Candidatus Peregrinibacteria bacterium CG_4_10_14_3_um_filter_44_21]PJB88766.1 MAG: glycine--tRNA ligase [Candidatus Peregrinibacteria bacterium CG_4_9_1
MADQNLMDKVVSLCKRRGFVFPGSEIYGGLANTWDYGPMGVELKKNISDAWWKFFVRDRKDMVGLDAAILMNPKVWQASGHVDCFNDALVDCKDCKARLRADHLIEDAVPDAKVEGLSTAELDDLIRKHGIKCPKCGSTNFTEARVFNLLFQTNIGPVSKDSEAVYLRGELAQSMFVDFKNIMDTGRQKIPFGIAQVGKCFRNEITPGNFIFRTIEFDLMEFEFFIKEEEWEKWFDYWLSEMKEWLSVVGIDSAKTRVREHTEDELSHYSKRTCDIEFETPFGWKELYGLAYRTDFDLKNHMDKTGINLQYRDPVTNEQYIPHVVEPTFGLTRSVLMVLLSAYNEEEVDGETRVVLKLNPAIAPVKVAVLPLQKKLEDDAMKVYDLLKKDFACEFDLSGSIGKRYRRQDEIGTPYCVTFDFESLEDNSVTVRDRDTMQQERISIDDLNNYLKNKMS